MKSMSINNELKLLYPESYHEMSDTELKKFFTDVQNRCGIYDEDRHIMVSFAWNDKSFFTFFTDAKSVVNGGEIRLKKNLVDYRRTDSMRCTIAGSNAAGIRYTYTASEAKVEQVGELYVFKCHRKFYFIQIAAGKDGFDECRQEVTELLRSLSVTD